MKASMLIALIALTAVMSTGAQARPPFPPTSVSSEPAVIVCKDLNALTEDEIELLNEDVERIVSVDLEFREVCYREN